MRHVSKAITPSRFVALVVLVFAGAPAAAIAQVTPVTPVSNRGASSTTGKWTVEFMTGWALGIASREGTASDLPVGTEFTTAGSRPTRAVSSWYFGDGAALLNDVLAQFSSANGTTFARITPIDGVLQGSSAERGGGVLLGARLTRALSSRLALEFGVDYRPASISLSGSAKDGLEASRASFRPALQGLLGTAPVSNLSVTSTLETSDRSGGQTQLTGALSFDVVRLRRARVYVVGGGGVVHDTSAVTATLTGTYSFLLLNTYMLFERDEAKMIVSGAGTLPLGLAGGGLSFDLTRKTGLRVDVRAAVNSGGSQTTVSGTPTSMSQSPTAALPTLTTPSVQFSSQLATPSSLSAPLKDVTTFRSGLDGQVTFTFGIFTRF